MVFEGFLKGFYFIFPGFFRVCRGFRGFLGVFKRFLGFFWGFLGFFGVFSWVGDDGVDDGERCISLGTWYVGRLVSIYSLLRWRFTCGSR